MATFDEFFSSLDLDETGILKKDKTAKGLPFERFVKWFLQNDPVWSSKIDKVWLNNEKDLGVDLIFDDIEGKRWAVQSKCYSPQTYITKKSIDSFISDSNDSRYQGRLLIASTDRIGTNADITLRRNKVVRYLLADFRNSSINFPPSVKELSKGKKKDLKAPRSHQEEAIDAVVKGLKTADRGQVLMACGTGKTLTSLWIKERLRAKQVLVLLPSLSLLSQTLKEWNTAASEPFKWICVCSDKSVAKKDKTEDDWITNTSEIGVPVSSETQEIKHFLYEKGSKIIFSTYQSSQLIAEAQEEEDIPAFDVVFADEAHRCAGKVSAAFGCVLDEQRIRAKKRLFFTATPRVLSNQIKGQAKVNDIEVASMDDSSLFGNILHELKFSDAINKKPPLLTDYQVVVVGVDDPMIQQQIIHRKLLSTDGKNSIDAETLSSNIALAKAIKDYNLRRIITFHGTIKGARQLTEVFGEIINWIPKSDRPSGEIHCGYVYGKMKAFERNEAIQRLKNITERERIVISNARCLSEGVDVPTLDAIAFIDPRKSQVDIIQAVGRAIRKSENKSLGTIILPVYLGDTNNIEDEILASRFKDIWQIILALKSQDDSLAETINSLRIEIGKKGSLSTNRKKGLIKIIFDLPTRVNHSFSDSLSTLLVENTSDSWMEMYGKLEEYYEKHGSARPPIDKSTLGNWVQKQRHWRDKNMLSKIRINLLEKFHDWIWDAYEAYWSEKFEALKKFFEENEHSNVPQKHPLLGKWVHKQRTLFNKNKLSKEKIYLSDEKISLLNTLDFVWDAKDKRWLDKYQLLKEYAIKNGHANPPAREKIIGQWVSNLRSVYTRRQENRLRKGEETTLTTQRIKLLQKLPGWTWRVRSKQENKT